MRKTAVRKSVKEIDAASTVPDSEPAKSPNSAASVRAKKSTGVNRTAQPVQQTTTPRISLAALATMGTVAAKTSDKARIARTARASKVSKPAPAVKSAKAAIVADVMATEKISDTTSSGRKLKGIRLAPNLDVVPHVIPLQPATPTASPQILPVVPAPVVMPEGLPPSTPKLRVKIRPATPAALSAPSCLATLWACLRNPPSGVLATLAALAIALAVLVSTQQGSQGDASSIPVAAQTSAANGSNGEPVNYGPGAYHPEARPYVGVGPGYASHYNYR